jgi:RND family efflux transporter MFP subunit
MNDNEPHRENVIQNIPGDGEGNAMGRRQLVVAPARPRQGSGFLWMAAIVVIGLVILAFSVTRKKTANAGDVTETAHTVAVATVGRQDLYNEVTIPGEFRPYVEAELDAKVSGYLTNISVDFGDKVKTGQRLAMIEVPELQDELNAAIAAEQKAEADYTNAHLIYNRLGDVNRQHPNLVAEQDIDTAQMKDSTAYAAVAAAKADVGRYQTLYGYTQITAPFDGVITRRYVDPGALIQSGISSGGAPLLRVSDNYRLRLDFPVSVDYVRDIHLGDSVDVRVTSLGGKTFTGTITRFTDRVNEETRTMLTELEVPNSTLEIVPGMYAVVVLKIEKVTNVLTIPVEAVASGSKNIVFTVNQNNEIEEHEVTLGLETPDFYQVTSGLKEGDRVMIGNHSQVHVGEKVESKPWTQESMKGKAPAEE